MSDSIAASFPSGQSGRSSPITATSGLPNGRSSNVTRDDSKLPSLLRYRATWKLLTWWTIGYGLTSWFVEYAFSKFDPTRDFPFLLGLNRVVYAVVWFGAILVAIVTTERLQVTSSRQIGRILFHIVACVVISIAWCVLAYYICLAIVPGWEPLGVGRLLSTSFKNVLFGYGLDVVLIHIILRVRVHRNQEVILLRQAHDAAESQLQLLKLEMQPHFLFNTLHAISAQIHTDPNGANETLVLVSDMLRHAVETIRVQKVSLREELNILQLYTQIQQVRFGDRLRLTWDIEDATLDAAVPHMLLQPLVENAIKHGLEAHSTAGAVVIRSRREGDELRLTIRDDGPGQRYPSPRRGVGVGLANVRNRLIQLYGNAQEFTLADAEGGGTEVTIRLPLTFMGATR